MDNGRKDRSIADQQYEKPYHGIDNLQRRKAISRLITDSLTQAVSTNDIGNYTPAQPHIHMPQTTVNRTEHSQHR